MNPHNPFPIPWQEIMTALFPTLEPEAQRVPPDRGPPTAVGTMTVPEPQESPEFRKLYLVTYATLQDFLVLQRGVLRKQDGETVLEDVAETLLMYRAAGRLVWLNFGKHFEVIYGERLGGKVDIELRFSRSIRKVPWDGLGLNERTSSKAEIKGQFWCMRNRPEMFAKYDNAVKVIERLDEFSPNYEAGVRVIRGVFDVPHELESIVKRLT